MAAGEDSAIDKAKVALMYSQSSGLISYSQDDTNRMKKALKGVGDVADM